ncbi:aminopeptidase P family protein [uncultured Cohaesibacter sp.]|uniref:aminopeptidase P family protein n=1 Tax=uncultured Cohaesibacter sp. TaxID=1002546 RepID=UPI0029C7C48A|nr:aminopeptidase P family protein [uncultured Cohaesibacter sp.]
MFQEFSNTANPEQGRLRIPLLRAHLQESGLDGYIMSRADEFGGENMAPYAERLAWLTGFTGSAGSAVILKEQAAIFVDGRYTLQVQDQVDAELITPVAILTKSVAEWLAETLQGGEVIGFDPWLYTQSAIDRFEKTCKEKGATLVACKNNPVDAIWTDRPSRPQNPIVPHPLALAGEASTDKLEKIAAGFAGKADATFITQGDSIAWLFNIRGSDVACAPLPLAFAIVRADGSAYLLTDLAKLPEDTRAHLPASVTIAPFEELPNLIKSLSGADKTWMLDETLVPYAIKTMIEDAGSRILNASDPCLKPKAVKNAAELAGMRKAHHRDGLAMCQFLHWLDTMAPTDTLDEITATRALEDFRAETGCLKDISFDTIAGAGPNGAIVHYHVTEATNRKFVQNSLFLIDSGGQYPDGTTDITRTIAIGTPDAEMKDRFTRVLKGMIALTLARFPEDTKGIQLDTLARQPLWEAGLDYAHGTGHGVGSYLCCHEGPQSISKRGGAALEAGNVLSNEPGYYKTGAWGIRIENLVTVTAAEAMEGGELPMHGFETLTLCPIDQRLIDVSLLTAREINWLNDYHEQVFAELSAELPEDVRAWLAEATKPLHA